MSELGLCSRREADEWIENGWVTVDGKVIGRGPASVTIDTGGTVFVTATLKGHKGWSKKVYLKKKTQAVAAKLEPIE